MVDLGSRTHAGATRPLLSIPILQQVLGAIWLVDGLLQLQPVMFTSFLTTGLMQPLTQGQPAPIAAALQAVIQVTQSNLILVNATIAIVQLALGLLLLGGWFVRPALLASVVWSLLVWFGGEGLGMLLTGQASALTGAPGAVILYLVLALAAYPTNAAATGDGLLPRRQLRLVLAGFWALAAVLQLQPYWWQPQQISNVIAGNENPGTINGTLLDGLLQGLANLTAQVEVVLNAAIIVIALALALGLARVRTERVRPLLAASIVLSLVLWVATEGAGQLLSGSATDFNSGLPLAVLALACWPVLQSDVRARAGSGAAARARTMPSRPAVLINARPIRSETDRDTNRSSQS
jgi:hypothetical protein